MKKRNNIRNRDRIFKLDKIKNILWICLIILSIIFLFNLFFYFSFKELEIKKLESELPAIKPFSGENYVPLPDAAKTDYLIGAFYVPVWKLGINGISPEKQWPGIDDYIDRKPLLGYYDGDNPEVIDWEIKWALEHGINFFIFDWYRCLNCMSSQEITVDSLVHGQVLHNGFFNSRYKDEINFTIMITEHYPYINNIFSVEDVRNKLMPFLIENYFNKPNYLKIDNKPVVFIYNINATRTVLGGNWENIPPILDAMREEAINAGFDGLIIAGDDINYNTIHRVEGLNNVKNSGFDYTFTYNWWMLSQLNLQTQQDYINEQIRALNDWNNSGIIPFFPIASMGWDSFPIDFNPGLPQWRLTPENFKKVLEYEKNISDQNINNNFGQKLILLDNWNEWSEGHYISPNQEYGFDYLKAVRDVFTDKQNNPDYRLPSELGLGHYDSLYQNFIRPRLVVHYAFENNANNSISDENHGIINGANLIIGKKGNAYSFDGIDDSINLYENYKLATPKELSFGGWLYQENLTNNIVPFGKSNAYRTIVQSNGGGHCTVATINNNWYSAGTVSQWNTGLIKPNKWHYILCVYNGSNVLSYIDGNLSSVSEGKINGDIKTMYNYEPFSIGKKHGPNSNYTRGIIDEVKIWNYALSRDEIYDDYLLGICNDSDNDGYSIIGGECGLIDCNDLNPQINPGAFEICGNGIDENCDLNDSSCNINDKYNETKIYYVNNEDLIKGYNKELKVNDILRFKLNNIFYNLIIESIEEDKARLFFSLNPKIEFTLNISEEKRFDFNNDSYYELNVKLIDINENKANIFVKGINEQIINITTPIENNTSINQNSTISEEPDDIFKKLLIYEIIFIIIIAIVIVIVIFIKKDLEREGGL